MGSKLPQGVQRRDLLMIPVEMITIIPDDNYTRGERGDIEGLAKSIAAEGIQNPIRCYRNGNGEFILRSGYRRMEAVCLINDGKLDHGTVAVDGIERVPVILEDRYANEADRAVRQLLENAHRCDASPMERAKAYRLLKDVHGLSVDEIADRLGEPKEGVKRYLTLLQASQPVRKALEKGQIAPTAATKIIKKHPDDAEGQKKALDLAVTASGTGRATTKSTTKATRTRKPRQRTRTVVEVKLAIEAAEGSRDEAVLHKDEGGQEKWETVIKTLKWVIGSDERPW